MTQDLIDRQKRRRALPVPALLGVILALVAALTVAAVAVSIGLARGEPQGRIALAEVCGVIAAGGIATASHKRPARLATVLRTADQRCSA